MITIRKAEDRGHFNHGWLETSHSFSFADYYDPAQMGFRQLRVINEDRVKPRHGFPEHSHNDMEILSYVLEGALEHRDSLGNGSVIRPGEVQRMSAGTGVTHSERNPSESEILHFLQIWIFPEKRGIEPGYEQKEFPEEERLGRLRLIGSPDGREGSVTIHQDVDLYGSLLGPGETVTHTLGLNRSAWVQLARGRVRLNDQALKHGDGAAVTGQSQIRLEGLEDAEILLFDLA